MRIAVTFHSGGRERAGHHNTAAEFVTGALERLGHTAFSLDVSDSLSNAIVNLEALDPDLVFNLSRGRGRHGDLLFPAVLEQLDLPFTGADAQASAVIRDRRLAKTLVALKGVGAPRAVFVREAKDVPIRNLSFPVVLKPNYDEDHADEVVVPTPAQLRSALASMLDFYPEGVLIEEFVPGQDVTMFYLASHAPYLPAPVGYSYVGPNRGDRRHAVYNHHLWQAEPDKVALDLNPNLPVELDALRKTTLDVVSALGITDAGEIQLRVSHRGDIYFLHASSMPRLYEGAPIYQAAQRLSCTPDDVVGAIVRSADRRWNAPVQSGVGTIAKPRATALAG